MMLLNNPIAYGQAKSRSITHFTGCKKGFENMVNYISFNPPARIFNGDCYTFIHGLCFYKYLTLTLNGLNTVCKNIQEHLVYLHRYTLNFRYFTI